MKVFSKESAAFIAVAFIIWTIMEIVIDLITGVPLAEILSVKYVVLYLVGAAVFAVVLFLFQLWSDKKKKN